MFGKRGGTSDAATLAPPPQVAAPAKIVPAPASPKVAAPPADAAFAVNLGDMAPVRRSEEFYDVKSTVFSALIDTIDLSQLAKLDMETAREEIRDIVNDIVSLKAIAMSIAEQEDLLEDICNDVLGFGPLEPLLARDDIADIMVNGAGKTYIEVAGKVQLTPIRFRDNNQLMNICQRIVSQVGRRVDESSPICDARLPDGSRVNVISPPLSIDGPTLTIRKFKKDKLTLDQLVRYGTITAEGAVILQIIGRSRCNVLISGGTGSGKTTLLNCLTRYIEANERIITCEDAAELQLQQPHVVRLESRPPNLEGEGEITMRDLVKNCLRMRPERIIVGEVRGPEAFDLLQAMNTGHDGSMGTLHANSPREALARIESLITMGGFSLPSKTLKEMIVNSIDVVVQVMRLRDGTRRITHITEVMGLEGDVITTQDIFLYDMIGEDANGRIIGRHRSTGIGRPRFWERARYFNEEHRLAEALDAANLAEQSVGPSDMIGSTGVMIALVVLAMLSAGALAYALLFGRIKTENQIGERLAKVQSRSATMSTAARQNDPAKRRKAVQESLRDMDVKEKARAKRANAPPLILRMQQAGLSWSRRTFILISVGCSLLAAFVALLIGLPLYAIGAAALAGGLGLPRWIVSYIRARRFKRFLNEFPTAVDVIVRGIKAGLPIGDCMRIIAAEAQEPVRSEFRIIVEQQQALGLPLADAVARLPERIPLPEANFFSIVITIQQKSGGNLSEALGNLARVLRERHKMKDKIRAMSMEAKASGGIIGSLPIIVGGLTYLTSPQYIGILFTDPVGHIILGASAFWMGTGILVMKKMIAFKF